MAQDTLFVTGPTFNQARPAEVMVTPTGGTQVSLQTIAQQAAAGAGGASWYAGTVTALGGSLVINSGTIADGLTTTASGQNTYAGINAGPVSTGTLNTFVGNAAGQANTSGGENTFLGAVTGQLMASGTFNTALGQHAMGAETVATSVTAVGNDSMRNWVSASGTGNGSNTAVGKSSMEWGGGNQTTAIGMSALVGNACAITLGGTSTNGDVITLTFTGTYTGSPHNVAYTISGTPTLATIATGLVAAINADATLAAGNISLGGTLSTVVDTSNINISLQGTGTTGLAIIVTASVSGAATETVTITNGLSGANNIAVGYQAMLGRYMSTAYQNTAIGTGALGYLTTGNNNVGIGQQAGAIINTGTSNVCIGTLAGGVLTTASNSVAIGQQALQTVATGGNNTAIGNFAMRFYNGSFGGSNQASVAVGSGALAGTAGNSYFQNVAVGGNAGFVITSGARNTLLGSTTGAALTSGATNTIIGCGVGSVTLTTGQSNIYIGAGASTNTIDAASGSESNTFRFGNHATNLMRATAINTASPAFFLDWIPGSTSYATDSAAATGGIAVGQIYRNGSVLQCRIS